MNSRFNFLFILVAFISLQQASLAQQKYYSDLVTDTIRVNFENHYKLSRLNIVPYTETIRLNNKLLSRNNYSISYRDASFKLSDSLAYSIFDTLFVTYVSIRMGLEREYKKRIMVMKLNQKLGDTLRVLAEASEAFTPESIFGSQVEKSGTLVRGFTVGTNHDFSLNSGLRLQLSGHLSKEIEIVAALSDQNTPIQPEGNTANLNELDKVFIQVKFPYGTGTFGDYELQKDYGEFGAVSRKLQGLESDIGYGGQKGYIAVATSKGKYTTNNFNGSDGMQGPYQLSGANGERDIIIIAGTEHVYLDGAELKRGERNDYIIDYSNAQITFTPNRLITSASRISVDFEYTDRQFTRSFFGAGVESKLFKGILGMKFQYMREGDDQNSPIDISLSDSDKAILAAAGNDRFKAVKSGVALAVPDSTGMTIGIYEKIDTTISGKSYSYYLYNPGNPRSLYTVTFSYVGSGNGDYVKESIGDFRFNGIGGGDYAPIIFLPMPQLKQLSNIVLDINPSPGIKIGIEYAGSSWDKNLFSSLDDNSNTGYARNITFSMEPRLIKIGSINLGLIGLSLRDRFVQDRFTSLDRYNPVEFNRDYNIDSAQSSQNEELREINLNLIPVKELNITSSYGLLKTGSDFSSSRFNNTIKFTDKKNYGVDYNFDYVGTKNGTLNSSWLRQKGSGYFSLGVFRPGLDFLAENRRDSQSGDSLLQTSLKYYEFDPYIQLSELKGLKLTVKYSLRNDYAPLSGTMALQSKSTSEFFELNYSGIREINSTLNFTMNDKKYDAAFKKLGYLDAQTILIRSQNRFNFWNPVSGDFYYEVSTQRSAKLQKVFIKVAQGAGNYIYLGDLNHNGIQDESEFQPTVYDGDYVMVTVPTDQLYPVIDLKTSTRWKLYFSRMFDPGSLAGKILRPFSSETYWRIEENSQEQDYKKIYLLHLSDFQNPAKTIYGFNYIQQDLFLFENDPEFSARLRYSQRKSMNQYSAGVEQSYSRERSLRINFKMIKEMSNQTDLVNQTSNVAAPALSSRAMEITGNSITSDFSYRPQNNIEVGFKLKAEHKEDDYPSSPTLIDLNSQALRFTLSVAGAGRLRIEFERDELTSNSTQNYLPIELTEGNIVGKNYYWKLNFDYKLAAFLQSTVSYDGRAQGGQRVVHTARAEVRAFF